MKGLLSRRSKAHNSDNESLSSNDGSRKSGIFFGTSKKNNTRKSKNTKKKSSRKSDSDATPPTSHKKLGHAASPKPSSKSRSKDSRGMLEKDAKNKFNLGCIYLKTDMSKAKDCFEKALAAREKLHGPNHPDVAEAHEKLADAYKGLGNDELAREHYDLALSGLETAEFKKSDDLAGAQMKVNTDQFRADKKMTKTKSMVMRRIEASMDDLPSEEESSAAITKDRSVFLATADKSKKPMSTIIERKSSGNIKKKDPPSTSSDASTLPLIADELIDPSFTTEDIEKRRCQQINSDAHSVNTTDSLSDSDHSVERPSSSKRHIERRNFSSIHQLSSRRRFHTQSELESNEDYCRGIALLNDNAPAEAKIAFESAYRVTYRKNATSVESSLLREKIGDSASMMGDYGEAQVHYEAALRHLRSKLGDRSEAVIRILVSTGDTYLEAGKHALAIKCFTEAHPVLREQLGCYHVVVLHVVGSVVKAYEETIKLACMRKAINDVYAHYLAAVKLLQPYFADQEEEDVEKASYFHPIILKISKHVGNLYGNMSRYDEALKVFIDCLTISGIGEYSKKDKREVSVLQHNVGILYEKNKEYSKAMEYYTLSLKLKKEVYGRDHLKTMKTVHSMAFIYLVQGEDERALMCLKEVLRVLKLKPDTENYQITASTLKDMAIIYLKKGEADEAAHCLEEKNIYAQRTLGYHHQDVAETFHRIGCIYTQSKKYEKAIEYHQKALKVKKVISSQTNRNTALTLRYLGICYDALKNFDKSLECYRESIPASNDLEKALVLNRMGIIYHKQNKLNDALDCFQQAIKIQSSKINDDYAISLLLNNMGNIHFAQGNDDQALDCYKRAFESSSQNNAEVATGALYNLGLIHLKRNSLEKAKKCFYEFVDIHRRNNDRRNKNDSQNNDNNDNTNSSSDLSIVLNNIGNVHYQQGNHGEAAKSYEMALQAKIDLYGENSPTILGTLSNLASAYLLTDDYSMAIHHLERALDIMSSSSQRQTRQDQIQTASLFNKLGNVYQKKNEYGEATKHYFQALALKRKAFENDDDHPEVLLTRHNIGLVLCKAGRYDEARELFQDVYKRKTKALGADHPELAKLMLDMGGLFLMEGRHDRARELTEKAVGLFKRFNMSVNHPYMRQAQSIFDRLQDRVQRQDSI